MSIFRSLRNKPHAAFITFQHNTSAGFVLIPVVLAIALVAVIAFMLNQKGAINTQQTGEWIEADQAQYAADAGLHHALWQIEQASCGPFANIAPTSFGNDQYSATITPNNAGGNAVNYTVDISDDAYISQDNPAQNYGSEPQARTFFNWIFFTPVNIQRALYRVDIETAGIPQNASILSATLKLYVLDQTSGALNLHKITADWDENSVNWDNININADSDIIATIPSNSPAGAYVELNITSLVQGWVSGATANQGVMLKATSANDLSALTTKEYGTSSQRPLLEIKIADGSLSTHANISATGTLPNGVNRTITRSNIPLRQTPTNVVWQPAAELEDTFTKGGKNYGISSILNIKDNRNTLIRYNLNALPPEAKIIDAKLELYLEDGIDVDNGVLDLHALSRDWVEGIHDGEDPALGEGATDDTYDGQNLWTTKHGDYDAAIIDSVTLPTMVPGWYEWNVTSQIQSWLDGAPNYGFLLREGGGDSGDIEFTSSDSIIQAQRPRLSITLACQCGISCQIPQGYGKILLVVGDDTSLSQGEIDKKALFEAWGYTITLINDNENQNAFDTAVSNNNVVYISETISDFFLGDKLVSAAIGVVSEEGSQNNDVGIASSNAQATGVHLEVLDNTHYITELFPQGVLPIYSAAMESSIVSGTQAPDLETLGNFNGSTGLAIINKNAALGGNQSGDDAEGRRAVLPIGRSSQFNWDYLNNNGRLMVQRTIQWGFENSTAVASSCDGTYRDDFDVTNFGNNDGSLSWTNDWIEVGESNGPGSGDVIMYDTNGGTFTLLVIKDNDNGGEGVMRELSLAGASSAQLSLDFYRFGLNNADDYATLAVSSTGTNGPWTEIARYEGPANDSSFQSASYDISAYISENTAIRLLTSPNMGANDAVRFDYIEIECSP